MCVYIYIYIVGVIVYSELSNKHKLRTNFVKSMLLLHPLKSTNTLNFPKHAVKLDVRMHTHKCNYWSWMNFFF